MKRILKIKQSHSEMLEANCIKNSISYLSMIKLLEAEKTKKLLKRNSLIQQTIDKEIENSIENENR